jgi:hypothetical protein
MQENRRQIWAKPSPSSIAKEILPEHSKVWRFPAGTKPVLYEHNQL